MIAPLVAEMEEEYAGKINFVSVDVDREPALAAKYGIQAMPTFLFLAPGGKETGRIVGADKEALTAKVKEMAGE
jgi:thioredoxin 1